MLKTCEEQVENSAKPDPITKLWVEQWYQQWNRITGGTNEPAWVTRAAKLGLTDSGQEPGL